MRAMIAYKDYRRFIVYFLIIVGLISSCTKSKVIENKQTVNCNLSDLSIFPHPNDAGITLSILAVDTKDSEKYSG